MEKILDLGALQRHCWQLLTRAAADRKSELRTPTIGTVRAGGARLRTVVLRAVDTNRRELTFYTDVRSAKVGELGELAEVTWHFYSPRKNVQLRLRSKATLHHKNSIAKTHWSKIAAYGRKTYGTNKSPGTVLTVPGDDLPDFWHLDQLPLEMTEYAYEHFAVVTTEAFELDYLHLHRSAHQRAQFKWENQQWEGTWAVP